MKITSKKISKKPQPGALAPAASITTVTSDNGEPWSPSMVLEAAVRESNRRPLSEYHDSIKLLRDEKRFTFREIAEWLDSFNIECDHNAVYREYTRGMPAEYAHEEDLRDTAIEEQEAGR